MVVADTGVLATDVGLQLVYAGVLLGGAVCLREMLV